MIKGHILFLVMLFFAMFTSCKTDTKVNEKRILYYKKDTLQNGFKEILIAKQEDTKIKEVHFKKESTLNKVTFGNIIYDLKIDTINNNEIGKRFVLFTASTDNTATDIDKIESTAQDGLLDSTSVDSVNFKFKVKFLKKGNNKLKLGIRDIIYLKAKDSASDILRLELFYIYEYPVHVKDSN